MKQTIYLMRRTDGHLYCSSDKGIMSFDDMKKMWYYHWHWLGMGNGYLIAKKVIENGDDELYDWARELDGCWINETQSIFDPISYLTGDKLHTILRAFSESYLETYTYRGKNGQREYIELHPDEYRDYNNNEYYRSLYPELTKDIL